MSRRPYTEQTGPTVVSALAKLRRRAAVIRPFQDDAGHWRWRIRAGNGQTIATSGEAFDSYSSASRAVDMILQARLVRGGGPGVGR